MKRVFILESCCLSPSLAQNKSRFQMWLFPLKHLPQTPARQVWGRVWAIFYHRLGFSLFIVGRGKKSWKSWGIFSGCEFTPSCLHASTPTSKPAVPLWGPKVKLFSHLAGLLHPPPLNESCSDNLTALWVLDALGASQSLEAWTQPSLSRCA